MSDVGAEFEKKVGLPIEKVLDLYKRAVQHDWQTVQQTTQQIFKSYPVNAGEAANFLKLTRAILAAENGKHLSLAGLPPL